MDSQNGGVPSANARPLAVHDAGGGPPSALADQAPRPGGFPGSMGVGWGQGGGAGPERIEMKSIFGTGGRHPTPPGPSAGGPDAAGPVSLVPLHSAACAGLIAATVLASMAGFLDASVVNVA